MTVDYGSLGYPETSVYEMLEGHDMAMIVSIWASGPVWPILQEMVVVWKQPCGDSEYCPAERTASGEPNSEYSHCRCWWEGEACCRCHAVALTREQRREQGMEDDVHDAELPEAPP